MMGILKIITRHPIRIGCLIAVITQIDYTD